MLTQGPVVADFEAELARACETRHALAVSSGTAALHVAVLALGLDPGDEVLVPAYTFPATANVVLLSGLKPVLVDVDPVTMNLDPERIAVTPRTKARDRRRPLRPSVPDRGAARPAGDRGRRRRARRAPRRATVRLARRDRLLQLPPAEDRHDGRGRRGDDERRAASPPRWRRCATTAGAHSPTPTCPRAGLNYRLSDLLAAVGLPQLRRLDELLAARDAARRRATRSASAHLPVTLPAADEGDVHGWQAYVIQVERRDEVLAALRAEGIEAQIGTFALPLLGAYRDQGFFPGAEHAFEHALALPFHTLLTESEQDRVAEALDKIVSHH